MKLGSVVFLQMRRNLTRDLLVDVPVLLHRVDLLLLAWDMDFLDLSDDEESADELLIAFGADLLFKHRDERGVLVSPASLSGVEANDYAGAVAAHGLAGLWLRNLSKVPGVRLVAGDEDEIPLPRFPKSKRVEFYVVKTAQAMRELELTAEPLRTVRLELRAPTTPRDVSAFYLPLLKAQGLRTKRRILSNGSAERLFGVSESVLAFVHSERRGPSEVFVQISWVQLA